MIKRIAFIEYSIGVAAWILAVYVYMHFPERVPMHWNFSGDIDGYAGKAFGAFFVPVLITFFIGLFRLIPRYDPDASRYAYSTQFSVVKIALLTFLLVVFGMTSSVGLGAQLRIDRMVAGLIGVLMCVIGCSMRGIQQNGFFGIRTPWTLRSEHVWKKTHDMSVWAFLVLGCCIALAPWLPAIFAIAVFVVGMLTVTIGLSVYSFLLYCKERLSSHSGN